MLRNPKKTLQAINNCVTVALPLTSIDMEHIIESVTESITDKLGDMSIENISDVDLVTEGVEDGSLLVYKAETQKWQSTRKLERQIINAGEY